VVAVTAFEMTVDSTSQQSHLLLALGQLFVEDLFLHDRLDVLNVNRKDCKRYLVSSVEEVGKMISAGMVLFFSFVAKFDFNFVVRFVLYLSFLNLIFDLIDRHYYFSNGEEWAICIGVVEPAGAKRRH
jgi:hypothetical protein